MLFAAEAAAGAALGHAADGDLRAARAAQGHTDFAIAGRLHISTRTVQTHLAHIYATLGINRRADLTSHLK